MTNDNYSTLQRNTLAGLSETAGCLYLKLLDVYQAHGLQANEQRAFKTACRYEDRVGEVLDYILRKMPNVPDAETFSALTLFFAERYRHSKLFAE